MRSQLFYPVFVDLTGNLQKGVLLSYIFEQIVNSSVHGEYFDLETQEFCHPFKSNNNMFRYLNRRSVSNWLTQLTNEGYLNRKKQKSNTLDHTFFYSIGDKLKDFLSNVGNDLYSIYEKNKANATGSKSTNGKSCQPETPESITNGISCQSEKPPEQSENTANGKTFPTLYNTHNLDSNSSSNISNDLCISSNSIMLIYKYWNEKKNIVHRKLTPKISSAIEKTLLEYSIDEIKLAIDHYSTIVKDKQYFYSYQWTLEEFLKREKGMPEFLNDGAKWMNYYKKLTKDQDEQQRTTTTKVEICQNTEVRADNNQGQESNKDEWDQF